MNPKNPADWSTNIVCAWANDLKYSTDTVSSLSANSVNGDILLTLNATEIRDELKIKSIAERRRLLADVTTLKAMASLERDKTNKEYQILESAIRTQSLLPNAELDFARRLQEKELVEYRNKQKNFAVAVEAQLDYNKLLYLDEIDAQLARRIGDGKSNREAEAAIKTFHDSLHANEAGRRQQNDLIIEELVAQEEEMDSTVEASVPSLEGGSHLDNSGTSELSMRFNAGMELVGIGARKSKESDEVSQVTSTTYDTMDTLRCIVCDDPGPQCCLPTTCKHVYCAPCLKRWLELAAEDESLLPLMCCKQVLPPAFVTVWARRLLSNQWATKLLSCMEENLCTNKMYCPIESCSAFINLDEAANALDMNMTFLCRACGISICFDCKTVRHDPSISCAINQLRTSRTTDEQALRSLGFQKCKGCQRFVELSFGCNHMTCRCKFEFCYVCGERWKTCPCEVTDQNRLLLEQERLVPENIVGERRARAVAERVREANAVINAEENCDHGSVVRTDDYAYRSNKPKCRQCSRRLNLFGYVCNGCNMKMCIECKLHR